MTDRFRLGYITPDWLTPYGITLPALHKRSGLPTGFFQQEKLNATTAQLLALWRAVGAMSPDPAVGLKLSGEPRFQLYNPASIAAVCSRTFGDALQRIARYKQVKLSPGSPTAEDA